MSILIADLPIQKRPRERLAASGADELSESELLALVLRSGSRGKSAVDLGAGLLAEYGGLARLATARPEDLACFYGIGQAKATALVAAFHLGRLVSGLPAEDAPIQGPEDVFRVSQARLAGEGEERVLVLVCDADDRLQGTEAVAVGSIDCSALPVPEILNCVLRNKGRAFAIAHNHPSGDPSPSDADVLATRALASAAIVMGLRFLEHVVVAGDEWAQVSYLSPANDALSSVAPRHQHAVADSDRLSADTLVVVTEPELPLGVEAGVVPISIAHESRTPADLDHAVGQ
jgi:DNA repair protein RadC